MNYLRLWVELSYLTFKFVVSMAMTSGEKENRGNSVVRKNQCSYKGRRGPVAADSLHKMRDSDLKMGLRREKSACRGINLG